MKTSISLLGAWLLAIAGFSNASAVPARASMRPALVAIQVENLDAAIHWYTTFLDFQQKDRRDFPDHQLELAILVSADFEIELVENAKAVRKSEVLASKKTTDITGFAKLAFRVDRIGERFQRLKDQGARFAIELRDSNTKPDERFFVVLDSEGNWLQFVGRK